MLGAPAERPPFLFSPLSGFPFARDYVSGEGCARELMPCEDAIDAAVQGARALTGWKPLSETEVAEVANFNREVGNPSGAALASRLGEPGTVAIVTGQQPNLLASPLYNVLKSLKAIWLARQVSERGVQSVIPLFWLAADDHDFEELRECWVSFRGGEPVNLGAVVSRGEEVSESSPAFVWQIDGASRERILSRLAPVAPRPVSERVADALDSSGTGFERAFCRMLLPYLGDQPMLFISPRLSFIRERQRSVLAYDVAHPGDVARLLAKRAVEIAGAGYKPMVTRDERLLNSFWLTRRADHAIIRARLVFRGNGIEAEDPATRDVLRAFTSAELLSELDRDPSSFSPNIATRPIVQDSALPVACYIAGPGELAYLAQLRPLYDFFGVRPAPVVLRSFATIIEPWAAEALRKLGFDARELPRDAKDLQSAVAKADPAISEVLALEARLQELLAQEFGNLEQARRTLSHPIQRAIARTHRSLQFSLNRLKERIARQSATHSDPSLAAIYLHLMNSLVPNGRPQERTLAPFCLMAEMEPAELGNMISTACNWSALEPQIV